MSIVGQSSMAAAGALFGMQELGGGMGDFKEERVIFPLKVEEYYLKGLLGLRRAGPQGLRLFPKNICWNPKAECCI